MKFKCRHPRTRERVTLITVVYATDFYYRITSYLEASSQLDARDTALERLIIQALKSVGDFGYGELK